MTDFLVFLGALLATVSTLRVMVIRPFLRECRELSAELRQLRAMPEMVRKHHDRLGVHDQLLADHGQRIENLERWRRHGAGGRGW